MTSEPRTCEFETCSKPLRDGMRPNARFCSDACQRRESGRRARERREAGIAPKPRPIRLVTELAPCRNPRCSVRTNRAQGYCRPFCKRVADALANGQEPPVEEDEGRDWNRDRALTPSQRRDHRVPVIPGT